MRCLDLTLPTPEENLACDEALLDLCEAGGSGPLLRFWEPQTHFVVLGYSRPYRTDVYLPACEKRSIPVLRRCSGGGTVLQGPGCLNFSLLLPIEPAGPFDTLRQTGLYVAQQHQRALEPLLDRPILIAGLGDLTLANTKFSGNAQRRKLRFTLYHGTLLLGLDLKLVEQLLPVPQMAPEYRQGRSHKDFLVNIPVAAEEAKQALRAVWNASQNTKIVPLKQIQALVESRYRRNDWTARY